MSEQIRPIDQRPKISPEEMRAMEEMRRIAYEWLAAFNEKNLKQKKNEK